MTILLNFYYTGNDIRSSNAVMYSNDLHPLPNDVTNWFVASGPSWQSDATLRIVCS